MFCPWIHKWIFPHFIEWIWTIIQGMVRTGNSYFGSGYAQNRSGTKTNGGACPRTSEFKLIQFFVNLKKRFAVFVHWMPKKVELAIHCQKRKEIFSGPMALWKASKTMQIPPHFLPFMASMYSMWHFQRSKNSLHESESNRQNNVNFLPKFAFSLFWLPSVQPIKFCSLWRVAFIVGAKTDLAN